MSATTATEKACTRCEATKPLDAFWRSPTGKHGRASRCKTCQTECDQTSGQRSARFRQTNARPVAAFMFAPEKDPSWREDAACQNHPQAADWFASPDLAHPRRKLKPAEEAAIKVCQEECPVVAECLAYWMAHPTDYGIHAGRTPAQLRALRRQRRKEEAAS